MTTIPNWLLIILLLLSVWATLMVLASLLIFIMQWRDNFKAEREKRKQAQKYQHLAVWDDAVECVDLLESETMK